jgi:hypothetical protein
MSGSKAHQEFIRTVERKSGPSATADPDSVQQPHQPRRDARDSEFPVSSHGMNQESSHNKHNRQPKGAPKH